MEIELNGLTIVEIKEVEGHGVSFKKIRIENEDCSNFQIQYKIEDKKTGNKNSGYITCFVSPYQRNASQVILNSSFVVPKDCTVSIQMHSAVKPNFSGTSFLEYETFVLSDKLVFISERDRQNAFRIELLNLARLYEIKDCEYMDNSELYDVISELKYPIINFLRKYFKAYNNWFKFYQDIKDIEEQTGFGKELNSKERAELSRLIQERESTMNILQSEFDKLQVLKFQKMHGLDNIDGIVL